MQGPKGLLIRPVIAKAASRSRKSYSSPTSGRDQSSLRATRSTCGGCDCLSLIAYCALAVCLVIFCTALLANLTENDTVISTANVMTSKVHLVRPLRVMDLHTETQLTATQVTPLSPLNTEPVNEKKLQTMDSTLKVSGSKGANEKKQPQKEKKPTKKDHKGPISLEIVDHGPEPHIQMIHGEKDGTIKQDMRIVLFENDVVALPPDHKKHKGSPVAGAPHEYTAAVEHLKSLPLFSYLQQERSASLEATMEHLSDLPQCEDKPIFLSMASVGDELYWQLIENFVYTMVKFDAIACSLVICVSDANCMRMCVSSHFPCYNFQSEVRPLPSVMEQIGEVKLFHVPKALTKGVDVFMLDLDVGFLNDPMNMVRAFHATPHIDIFVQEDLIFIMNRTKAGWKTWFTQPLPNIGLFLCRGNEKTARMFEIAWNKYIKMEDKDSKANPGKDQNHVLEAMRIGRGTFGLRYAYFSNSTAMLLDKMVLNVDRSVELGGEASGNILAHERTLASHTTCYEHTTKVLGLKATNSFWNPLYYDPLRPTITKQILYSSETQVLDEVRTLLWLGMVTGRAVIIPNLYGREDIARSHKYKGQVMWPGFRVAKIKRERGIAAFKVDILEPAFYWRVQRDYDDAPKPHVVMIQRHYTAADIRDTILALGGGSPRVILHIPKSGQLSRLEDDKERVMKWAQDSVGLFELPFTQELDRYEPLPSVRDIDRNLPKVSDVLAGLRLCDDIFTPHKGNRSCFQICE
jgi:hypothetical protein